MNLSNIYNNQNGEKSVAVFGIGLYIFDMQFPSYAVPKKKSINIENSFYADIGVSIRKYSRTFSTFEDAIKETTHESYGNRLCNTNQVDHKSDTEDSSKSGYWIKLSNITDRDVIGQKIIVGRNIKEETRKDKAIKKITPIYDAKNYGLQPSRNKNEERDRHEIFLDHIRIQSNWMIIENNENLNITKERRNQLIWEKTKIIDQRYSKEPSSKANWVTEVNNAKNKMKNAPTMQHFPFLLEFGPRIIQPLYDGQLKQEKVDASNYSKFELPNGIMCHMDMNSGVMPILPQWNLNSKGEILSSRLSGRVRGSSVGFYQYLPLSDLKHKVFNEISPLQKLKHRESNIHHHFNATNNLTLAGTAFISAYRETIEFDLCIESVITNSYEEKETYLNGIVIIGVMLGLASVCIDLALPLQNYRDRLLTQISLLLVVAIQYNTLISLLFLNTSHDPGIGSGEEYTHGEIDSSTELVITIVYFTITCSMIRSTLPILVGKCRNLQIPLSVSDLDSFTCVVPLSVFLSLILMLLVTSIFRQCHLSSTNIFLLCFSTVALGSCLNRCLHRRKLQEEIEFGDISIQSNIGGLDNQQRMDERNWFEWSSNDVVKWISTLEREDTSLQKHGHALLLENINGKCLDRLTTQDLKMIGVPYGDASRLMHHIDKLTSKYDGGTLRREELRYARYHKTKVDDDDQIIDNCLGDTFVWNDYSNVNEWSTGRTKESKIDNKTEFFDEEMKKRMQDLFKNRFGINMADLQSRDDLRDNVNGNSNYEKDERKLKNAVGFNFNEEHSRLIASDQKEVKSIKEAPITNKQVFLTTSSLNPSDAHILNEQQKEFDSGSNANEELPQKLSMPKHIQEIVKRRPDLVELVLKGKT